MSSVFARVRAAAILAVLALASAAPAGAAAVAAPANLRPVQNRQDCVFVTLARSAACDAAVRAGQLQLLWDEPAGRIDGYRIIRVDGQRHVLIARLATGIAPAFATIAKPRDGYRGKCYAVEAYLGADNSADSPPLCVTPTSTAVTRLLGADRLASLIHWAVPTLYRQCRGEIPTGQISPARVFTMIQPSGFTSFFPWLATFVDPELVGSTRELNVAFAGVQAYGLVTGVDGNFVPGCPANTNALAGYAMVSSRTGLDFNLRRVWGHKVYAATLSIDAPSALRASGTKYIPAANYSCATSLAVAKSEWWRSGEMPFFPQGQATFGLAPVPSVTLDVTPIVGEWAANFGRGDDGFILRSRLEDGTPIQNYACMTRYANPRLNVVYF